MVLAKLRATTLSIMPLNITTLSIMILSVMKLDKAINKM